MNPVRNAGFVSGGNPYPQGEDRRHNSAWLRPRRQPQPFQPVQRDPSGLQVQYTTPMPAPPQISVRVQAPDPAVAQAQISGVAPAQTSVRVQAPNRAVAPAQISGVAPAQISVRVQAPDPALAPVQISVRVRTPGQGQGQGQGQYNNISIPPGGMFYHSIPPASQEGGFPEPVISYPYQAQGPGIPPTALHNNISYRPLQRMLYPSHRPASQTTGIIHPPNHRYQAEGPTILPLAPAPHHREEGVPPPHPEAETRREEAEIPAKTPLTRRAVLTPEITKIPLKKMITDVVEYWFTPANLIRDDYLKARMDEEGWVPISFINSFPGLQAMNVDPSVVADNMRDSLQAEVRIKDLMIRKRGDWFNYLPQPP